VLARNPADPMAEADAFLAEHQHDVARVRELQQRAAGSATPSALMAIAARCERLRPAGS